MRLRVVAIHERFAEETTRPLSGIEGPRHLLRPAVERLLAEDVLSRLERADRPLHVHRVRQRDVDRLDVWVLEQRVVRAVRALDAPLARVRLGTALVAAGNGDQIDLLRRLRSRNQLPVDVGGREEPPANRLIAHALELFQRRIQHAKASVTLVVLVRPSRRSARPSRERGRSGDRLLGVAKTPLATPASSAAPYAEPSSTAVARAAARAPRRRSRARARCARRRPRRGRHAASTPSSRSSSSESRRPYATPSSTARTSAPRSCSRDSPANAPARDGSACGVRSPWQVREEREPRPRPGGHALRLGRRARRTRRRARARRGTSAATRRRTASRPSPPSVSGTAWQKACTRACGSGAYAGERREDDARRAEHDRERARRRSTPTPSAPPADRPRRRSPSTRVTGGSHSRGISSAAHDLVAPAPVRDVEEQRPRGVGRVDRRLAGQPQADVVLGQQDAADPRVDLGLVAAQPEQLRRGEAGQRAVAGERDQPLEPDALLDLRALGSGALVVPEDRRPQHAVRRRRGRRARASGRRGRSRPVAAERARARLGRAPPVLGILLRPAGLRRRERVLSSARRDDLARRARSRAP